MMRINKHIASNTELSRRKADKAILEGRVKINGKLADLGSIVSSKDKITIDEVAISNTTGSKTVILLNKPVGYVCSKNGQGNRSIYRLIPANYRSLNIAGRLDKDSSGLVILTDDGVLLQQLTHPSFLKKKHYLVLLDKTISKQDIHKLITGVDIGDSRLSKFLAINKISTLNYSVKLGEGRNKQIRRTFEKLRYTVLTLNRVSIGKYELGDIPVGKFEEMILEK